jgi:hypothetical protein
MNGMNKVITQKLGVIHNVRWLFCSVLSHYRHSIHNGADSGTFEKLFLILKSFKFINQLMRIFIATLLLLTACACNGNPDVISDSKPVSHEIWDKLLQKYVDDRGLVNYEGFASDSLLLNQYLDLLRSNHPNSSNWSEEEQLAYWINAYNAFTVQLIIRHYPVKSIKDIAGKIPFVNTPWDIKFIRIEGAQYDLNNIEHGIIRKEFKEPRIHFALVCAAMSCPRLRREAYNAKDLEAQLEEETRYFFNNPDKNRISENKVELSKLLDWYWGDFKDVAGSRIEYINRYSDIEVSSEANVQFLEYHWELNEQ